jgi:hypothetical protein
VLPIGFCDAASRCGNQIRATAAYGSENYRLTITTTLPVAFEANPLADDESVARSRRLTGQDG